MTHLDWLKGPGDGAGDGSVGLRGLRSWCGVGKLSTYFKVALYGISLWYKRGDMTDRDSSSRHQRPDRALHRAAVASGDTFRQEGNLNVAQVECYGTEMVQHSMTDRASRRCTL